MVCGVIKSAQFIAIAENAAIIQILMEIDRQSLEKLMIERSRIDLEEARRLHAGTGVIHEGFSPSEIAA